MNAPTSTTTITPTLELLPIPSMRPSETHIQTLRRQNFDTEKLFELSASIQASGLLQPILVRPITPAGAVKFEIVAGERRWMAAHRAGLDRIQANVRDMTDEQVLEAQLIENLQRVDLRPLEEAEGYRELMDLKHITADELASLIGKSRGYVYARIKLLELSAAGRQALTSGALDASKALLIARIRGEKLQARALQLAQELGAHYSYRRLVQKLREDFMIPLSSAPFAIDEILPAAKSGEIPPACIECPDCSANDPELRSELGTDAHVCTNRGCFDLKCKIFWLRARRDAEAAGRAILTGDEAKRIIPGPHDGGLKGGFINLDADSELDFPEPMVEQRDGESDEDYERRTEDHDRRFEAWTPPSVRQVLGADLPAEKIVLAEGKQGRLVELVPVKAVAKLLKEKGAEISSWRLQASDRAATQSQAPEDPAKRAAEKAREEERQKVELEYRARLFKQVFDKWKGQLRRADLERIAELLDLDKPWCDGGDLLRAALGDKIEISKLKEPDLVRAIALQPLAEEASGTYHKPTMLLEAAQQLKIDAKKVRAQVIKELKPVSAPAAATAKKPAAKKKAAKKTTTKKAKK